MVFCLDFRSINFDNRSCFFFCFLCWITVALFRFAPFYQIFAVRNFHLVGKLFSQCGVIHFNGCLNTGISGRITDTHIVFSFIQNISCLVFIIICHVFCIIRNRQNLRFARCKFIRFCKSAKFLIFFLCLCRIRCGIINLYDFFSAVSAAGIGNFYFYGNFIGICCHRLCLNFEICVGKSITKLVFRCDIKGIKIAVADINTFVINFFLDVSVCICKGI